MELIQYDNNNRYRRALQRCGSNPQFNTHVVLVDMRQYIDPLQVYDAIFYPSVLSKFLILSMAYNRTDP